MKPLDDIDHKSTVEDCLTLKKTDLVTFLRKFSEKISGNKSELTLRCYNVNQLNHGIAQHIKSNDEKNPPILIFKLFPLLQSLTRGGLAHNICTLIYCIKVLKNTQYS
jgi:hypothetical protein